MKRILILVGAASLMVTTSAAQAFGDETPKVGNNLSQQVGLIQSDSQEVYEDKIDVSYLSKLIITPKDDWVGRKVYKHGVVCIEVTKELKFKNISKPFEHLYRSANLPKSIDIGVIKEDVKVVDCSEYVSKTKVIE